ncbi:hypothetical protein LMG26846_01972 [Achromobacter insuavis]|nr:hypothetical protein LMG26846_01972 [Achromobacter insuavis]
MTALYLLALPAAILIGLVVGVVRAPRHVKRPRAFH